MTEIQSAALDATAETLVAATEAVAWAVVSADPERAMNPPPITHDPPRDRIEAAHRVVVIADELVAAVRRYQFLSIDETDGRSISPR